MPDPALPAARPLGELFGAAFGRLRSSWVAFTLLALLAPLGVGFSAALVAALAFGAMAGIHGAEFTSRLSDPTYLLNFFTIPENRMVGLALAGLAGFLSLRWLSYLWKAGMHAALEPGAGLRSSLAKAKEGSFGFLAQLILSFALVQLGSALLFLPGLAASVFLTYSSPASAAGAGPLESFKQSFALAKPRFWPLFVRLLVLGIAGGLLMAVPVLGWVAGPALWLCGMAELYREAGGETFIERRSAPREELSPFGAVELQRSEGQTGGPPPAAAPQRDDLTWVFERAWALFKLSWWKLALIFAAGLAGAGLGLLPLAGSWAAAEAWPEHAAWAWGGGGFLGALGAGWGLAWLQASLLAQSFEPEAAPGSMLAKGAGLAWPLLWLGGLMGLCVLGGLLLGLLPGLYFALSFALAPQALVREGRRGLEAMAFSQALLRGRLGKSAAFLVVLLIASGVLGNIPLFGSLLGMLFFTAFYEAWAPAPPAGPLAGGGQRAAWLVTGALGLAWIPLALALSGKLDLAALRSKLPGQAAGARPRSQGAELPPPGWSGVFLPDVHKLAAVAADGQGGVWVLDGERPLIVHLGPDGAELGRVQGPPEVMTGAKDLAMDEAGNLYVAGGSPTIHIDEHGEQRERGANHLLKFDPQGALALSRPGPGSAATALACDGQGGLYLLDERSAQVFHLDASGQVLWQAACGTMALGNPFYGTPFTYVPAEGRVYFADYEAERLVALDAASGTPVAARAPAEKPFTPTALAPAPGGGLWLVSGRNWALQSMDAADALTTVAASDWAEGAGPALSGYMDLAVDAQGRLFLGEDLQRRVVWR